MTNPGRADAVRAHRSEQWGETKDSEGAGRRIFVGHVPTSATIEDYRTHFGREHVEGVFIGDHYAFIQFKQQRSAEYFTMRGYDYFLDHKVNIRPYRVDSAPRSKPARPSLSSYSATSRALVPFTVSSKRSRSRSKSPASRGWGDHGGRERSSSRQQHHHHRERSEERDRKRNHERRDSERKHEHRSNRSSSSSSRARSRDHSDRSHHHHHSRKKDEVAVRGGGSRDTLRYRGMNDHHASWMEEKGPRWIEEEKPLGTGEEELPELTMPYGVELVLKLALDQGSVRGLSVHQINEVIKFFESERDFIMQANGINCDNNNSVQLPQSSSMIEYGQPVEAASHPQIEPPEPQELEPPAPVETAADVPSIEQSTTTTEGKEVKPRLNKTESGSALPESIRATAELIRLSLKR